jgi:O-antigen/teichoic acid export membrane protein
LLTTIIVGRYCGAEGLGLFSLAMSAVILARGMEATLVAAPYTVFRSRIGDRMTPETHAGGSLAGAFLLATILTAATLITAFAFTVTAHAWPVRALIWALVLAIPFSLAREFARRFDMARMDMTSAMGMDASVAALQLTLLLGFAFRGQLSGATAIFLIGVSCAAVTMVWLHRRRNEFSIQRGLIASSIKHDWGFGRWLLADALICFSQLYAMHWLLAAIMGTSATGVFAACASIAALASPLLQGIGNYLSPRFAETVSSGSRQETMRLYWRSTIILALAVTSFAVVASIFSRELLWLLYRDEAYDSYGAVVGLLAFRMAFGIPAVAAHHAVVAMECPRASAGATAAGLITTICIAFPAIYTYGVMGAAISVLVGTACECVVLICVFAQCSRNWNWQDEPENSLADDVNEGCAIDL